MHGTRLLPDAAIRRYEQLLECLYRRDQKDLQPEMPRVTSPMRDDKVDSKLFAWATLILWLLFLATVIVRLDFRWDLVYLECSWWLAGTAGIVAGSLGLRKHRLWHILAALAALLLVVSSAFYWSSVIETLLRYEEQKTGARAVMRVWQMHSIGLYEAFRTHSVLLPAWALATIYREILMPGLQFLVLIFMPVPWIVKHARVSASS